MKKKTSETIFALIVFGLIYAVLNSDIQITGSVIQDSQSLLDEPSSLNPKITTNSKDGTVSYEIYAGAGLDQMLRELDVNDRIIVRKGENSYQMTVIRVLQDYKTGVELMEFFISPGDRRVLLNEKKTKNIDFNNDYMDDLQIRLDEISYGKASITLSAI